MQNPVSKLHRIPKVSDLQEFRTFLDGQTTQNLEYAIQELADSIDDLNDRIETYEVVVSKCRKAKQVKSAQIQKIRKELAARQKQIASNAENNARQVAASLLRRSYTDDFGLDLNLDDFTRFYEAVKDRIEPDRFDSIVLELFKFDRSKGPRIRVQKNAES